jgi:hypothetical protein
MAQSAQDCTPQDAVYGGEASSVFDCQLPVTGSEPLWLVGLAFVFIILGGAGLTWDERRKRREAEAG